MAYPPYPPDIDIGSIQSLLKNFNNEELDSIVNDSTNEHADIFIKDLPQIKKLEEKRDKLIEENKKFAEQNLSVESSYHASRQALLKSLKECKELKAEMDKKQNKLREFGRQNSLDTVLALMQAASAEAEEASEEIAQSFIKKDISIEEFLKEFKEKRKLFHERRIKAEKMPAEINRVQSLPQQPWRPPTYPFSQMSIGGSNDSTNSNNQNPPYPTNPFGGFFPYPHYQ